MLHKKIHIMHIQNTVYKCTWPVFVKQSKHAVNAVNMLFHVFLEGVYVRQCCNKSPLLESQVKSSQKYSIRESSQVIIDQVRSSKVIFSLQVTSSQYGVVYCPFVR